MDETNDLSISLGLDPTDLRQGLNDAERIIETSAQRIRASIERIGNLGQQLAGLGATMTASLTLPIVGLATASIQAYGDIQALQKGLEAVMGSAERANAEFTRLKEVAKLPGLGLEEAVKGSINLQSIGLSAKNSRNILLQFGNAVATVGKGRAEFERAVYGVQQLANTDFPLGEDLNIIKDAIPQVSSLLKEAFGTSRSDDLQKLKVSSKQVLDVILEGLGKLPRVTGGIKGTFENLSDSMKSSLGRIGKIIDDAFDISGIVEKITNYVDKIVSAFESLDPSIQRTILIVAGLVAALGPLLVAVGGFLALLPTMIAGITAIGTGFTLLLSPIGLVTVAILGVVTAVVANWGKIKPYLDETILSFKILYNESVIFRTAIGTLAGSFVLVFKTGIESLKLFYENFKDVGKAILNIFSGIGKGIEGVLTFNPKKIQEGFVQTLAAGTVGIKNIAENSVRSIIKLGQTVKKTSDYFSDLRFDLTEKIKLGGNNIAEDIGVDKLIKGLDKTKKETQKQLAEIYPVGSIAELRQRASLLLKAIETSNNDIIKIRGLDKFGKETNKVGLPIYTGEILSREKAVDRLADLNMLIGEELKPVKFEGKGFLNGLGEEFKTLNDYMYAEVVRMGTIIGDDLPNKLTEAQEKALQAKLRLDALFVELNESVKNLIQDSTINGVVDVFSALGNAIGSGENALQAVGKSIIGTLGNFMQEFGKQLIKTALLSEVFAGLIIAIENAFGNPYVLLAVGAAAVALGAVLTGSVKNTASTASGGGSISSASGTGSSNFTSSNFSGGNGSGGEYVFRLSGADLVATFNRNVSAEDRVSAS